MRINILIKKKDKKCFFFLVDVIVNSIQKISQFCFEVETEQFYYSNLYSLETKEETEREVL